MSVSRLVRGTGWLVMLLVVLLPHRMFAQNPVSITIDRAGFDDQGHAVIGVWFPVVVTLENNGGDLQGTLAVETNSSRPYAGQTLDLPGGARKQVTLFVRNDNNDTLLVKFVKNDGSVVARATTRIISHQRTETLIGLVGMQPAALAGFRRADTTLVFIEPADFAATDATLANFRVLLLGNVTPTAEQAAALERWVAAGGILLLDAGASSDGIAPELRQLAAASVDMQAGTRTASFDPRTIAPNTGNAKTLTIRPIQASNNATVVAKDGDQALIVKRQHGIGSVITTAFDVADLPIERGNTSVWNTIIQPRNITQWILANAQWRQIGGNNGLPSTTTIMSVLLLYILTIGPLNYFLLRKLDRREWAWFSIPLMVIVFVVIAYIGGKDLRSLNLSVASVNVLDSAADSTTARMTSISTVTSGRRSTWNASIAAPHIAGSDFDSFSSESNADLIDQRSDGSTLLPQWKTNVGSTSSLVSMGFSDTPYQIDAQNLRWNNGWQAGTITNRSSVPLANAALVINNSLVRLPTLAPNETFTLDGSIVSEESFPYAFNPSNDSHNQALQTLFDNIYSFDSSGSLPSNSVYSLPRVVVVDETSRLPLTFEENVAQRQINIYNIFVEVEGVK